MSKILVTGGAGFIGSHLCERLLKEGHQVICLDNFQPYYSPEIKEQNIAMMISNQDFSLVRGDIRREADLDFCLMNAEVDMIVHLAAMAGVRPSIEDPELYTDVNITGTMQVLQACLRHDIRKLLFASSSSVYGNREGGAFSETDNVDYPISPYAATKKAGELLCHTYHHLFGMSVACLRFFTVYGPRQRPDLAIHKFTDLIYHNKPITLYGDGESSRDYTFVDDIIGGIVQSLEYVNANQCYEIFNLGESQTIRLHAMISMIEKVSGKKAEIIWQPMQAGDVLYTCADISKSRNVLGYNPGYDFQTGITRFIEWFEQNF